MGLTSTLAAIVILVFSSSRSSSIFHPAGGGGVPPTVPSGCHSCGSRSLPPVKGGPTARTSCAVTAPGHSIVIVVSSISSSASATGCHSTVVLAVRFGYTVLGLVVSVLIDIILDCVVAFM